jgi:5-methylcytosine-specific restriction endonuclease McrA
MSKLEEIRKKIAAEQCIPEKPRLNSEQRNSIAEKVRLSAETKRLKHAENERARAEKIENWERTRERTIEEAHDFYLSAEWKQCKQTFKQGKPLVCAACQDDLSGENYHRLNVDHIKPLRLFWELRTDMNNLQILCVDCNYIKGNNYVND